LYWLHQALAQSPEHEAAHRALAAFYESQGDANKAADHRKRLAGPTKKTAP
jgi:Tfp pilus assembly protein PilF